MTNNLLPTSSEPIQSNAPEINTFSTFENLDILQRLEAVAKRNFDGHLTIMRFTTNWRIGFHQPDGRDIIGLMPEGHTFREAAERALAKWSVPPTTPE